jgi:hypothetical protein
MKESSIKSLDLFDKHRDSYHFIFKIVPRNDKSQEFEGPKTN